MKKSQKRTKKKETKKITTNPNRESTKQKRKRLERKINVCFVHMFGLRCGVIARDIVLVVIGCCYCYCCCCWLCAVVY